MSVNEVIAKRFYKYFKYLRIVTTVAFLIFVILNAINTGNAILYWIIYGCLMVTIAGGMQCVLLNFLSKYYIFKKHK